MWQLLGILALSQRRGPAPVDPERRASSGPTLNAPGNVAAPWPRAAPLPKVLSAGAVLNHLPPPLTGGTLDFGTAKAAKPPASLPAGVAKILPIKLRNPPAGETQAQADAAEAALLASPQGQAVIAQNRKNVAAINAASMAAAQKADKAARVSPSAEPADINAWLPKVSHDWPNGIVDLYPEFNWQVTQTVPALPNTGLKPTPIAWQGFYQRSSSDWVHWSASAQGQEWAYVHNWGSSFDLIRAVNQAAALVKQVAGDALQPFESALGWAYSQLNTELDNLAADLPPALRPWILVGLKQSIDWLAGEATLLVNDPGSIVGQIPWQDIADEIEAATSTIPLLGTAVSDIIATAEFVYQCVVDHETPLEEALNAAYDYAMASAPGAAALRPILDPIVDAIIRLTDEKPTAALCNAILDQVPASPQIGGVSPRTVAASLIAFVLSRMGLAS